MQRFGATTYGCDVSEHICDPYKCMSDLPCVLVTILLIYISATDIAYVRKQNSRYDPLSYRLCRDQSPIFCSR